MVVGAPQLVSAVMGKAGQIGRPVIDTKSSSWLVRFGRWSDGTWSGRWRAPPSPGPIVRYCSRTPIVSDSTPIAPIVR
jgi:hypothetical protein